MYDLTCEQCSKTFRRSARPRGAHVYCSTDCYHAATNKARRLICLVCGKAFSVPISSAKRGRRFCSHSCYLRSRVNKVVKLCPVCGRKFTVNGSIAERYTVCSWRCRAHIRRTVVCMRCGKSFTTNSPTRRYCSEACYRPPRMFTCLVCGKTFRKQPSSHRRFCSMRCCRSYQGETRIEKSVREVLESALISFEQECKIGRYSVDFAFPKSKLVLEVDSRYWHQDTQRDARKTRYLQKRGWTVIRITDRQIKDSENLRGLIIGSLSYIPGFQVARLDPPA